MPWVVEEGIGEDRAALLDRGRIVAARLEWPNGLKAGLVAPARLIAKPAGSRRGSVRFGNGEEALADGLPATATEGAEIVLQVTRPALAETGRYKRALARPTDRAPCPAPALAQALGARTARRGELAQAGWGELIAEARDGSLAFPSGTLHIAVTPAMTVIDVDGKLPPLPLCLAAIPAIAAARARLDLAGNIGIDFPTLSDKTDRRAVDSALASALGDWPHERTAMNGFGFIQLVSRLERASLPALLASDPAGAAARELLRRAEGIEALGTMLLTAPGTVLAATRPEWRSALERRTGRTVRYHADDALALHGGFAQSLAS